MLKFLFTFLLLLCGLFALELIAPIQTFVIAPWTALLAKLCAELITVFDSHVISYGNVIQSQTNSFGVAIQSGCNAVEATIVLIAVILAFAAPWRHKLKGIVVGVIAVQGLNILRIISLFYLGRWRVDIFEFAHLYLWQALIMLDVLAVFLVWVRAMPDLEPRGHAT